MLKQSNTTFFNSQNAKKNSKNTKILKQQEFKKSKRKLLKRAKTQARLG